MAVEWHVDDSMEETAHSLFWSLKTRDLTQEMFWNDMALIIDTGEESMHDHCSGHQRHQALCESVEFYLEDGPVMTSHFKCKNIWPQCQYFSIMVTFTNNR